MTAPNVSALADGLSEAQRDLLLRLEPTLEEQPLTEDQFFNGPALCVEHHPARYEDGVLVNPGERTWFAGSTGTFSNGVSSCRIALNRTGLAVRQELLSRKDTGHG